MRLSKIKLAGFKSFVDPTTIVFPSNLIGVVGPNGCGKSNVIDAVRWVMGESSAKHLRGDSMADVIFNGSSARKPVGTASIELFFDNSDGAVGGQYASYAEISIKRVVSRDGTSVYYLNNARCRRKDITHIFLGTGLGPRSYAIIEQGMISRLIEAKPEELRTFLEEAAGISKYKERRRETENRIRHTKENLERLNDLRDEVEKQIKHLQRQARTAERYRTLKSDERKTGAELLALKLRDLDTKASTKSEELSRQETALQAAIADQRALEASIEKARESLSEDTDDFNTVQGGYYKVGSEIARLEQSIQHGEELRERQAKDLEQAESALRDIHDHIEKDQGELESLTRSLEALAPDLGRAREAEQASGQALQAAETAMHDWQRTWDAFNEEANEAYQNTQVERTRIEHLEKELQRLLRQRERVEQEQKEISSHEVEKIMQGLIQQEDETERLAAAWQSKLESQIAQIQKLRDQDRKLTLHLDECRADVQKARGRLASLEALQQAALGKRKGGVSAWLENKNLHERPRLAQRIDVRPNWERAVETVLGSYLEAVCVEGIDTVAQTIAGLKQGSASFIEVSPGASDAAAAAPMDGERLSSKVTGEAPLDSLLGTVWVADSLADALVRRDKLQAGESVITRDGIWLGSNWLRVNRDPDEHIGVIGREKEMTALRKEVREQLSRVEQLEKLHHDTRIRLKQLEDSRDSGQQELNRVGRAHADVKARLEANRSRLSQITQQISSLERASSDVSAEISLAEAQLKKARGNLELGLEGMKRLQDRRGGLEKLREQLKTDLSTMREKAQQDQARAQEMAIKVESRRSTKDSADQSLRRMQTQLSQFSERTKELSTQLEDGVEPMEQKRKELQEKLGERLEVEKRMAEARRKLEAADNQLRELEQKRSDQESSVDGARQSLDNVRMVMQEVRVRREAFAEQFDETGFELAPLSAELAQEATIEEWEEQLTKLSARIGRLGPINLAAIDEFKEQSERKEYLDAQFTDLTDALDTLENAIRKIDRETRSRFRETFDKVNDGLKTIFPRLFGGGQAFLELAGDDLLSSGVTVMARPPGKRISTIHLLSGGEKALTAVALVFAIFELNPAPFCLLDEVDAPLDDANVGRFCDIVKEMSERVQFVVITHNKATMEMVQQLTGVTMNEPGVSRLVSVDVDEAVQMAAM